MSDITIKNAKLFIFFEMMDSLIQEDYTPFIDNNVGSKAIANYQSINTKFFSEDEIVKLDEYFIFKKLIFTSRTTCVEYSFSPFDILMLPPIFSGFERIVNLLENYIVLLIEDGYYEILKDKVMERFVNQLKAEFILEIESLLFTDKTISIRLKENFQDGYTKISIYSYLKQHLFLHFDNSITL